MMWVEYEDGARLSRSAVKPGSFSPLTRDSATNNLGHVTLDPIDESQISQPGTAGPSDLENFLRDVAVEVAVAVTLKAAEKAKPHVERWAVETAVPVVSSALTSAGSSVGSAAVTAGSALGSAVASAGSAVASAGSAIGAAAVSAGSTVGSAAVSAGSSVGSAAVSAGSAVASAGAAVGSTVSSAWNRANRKKGRRVVIVESPTAPADAGPVGTAAAVDAPQDVADAVEAYRAGMSPAEARQRIVAALAARLFSEQQIAIVGNARIDEGGDIHELDSATLALAQAQIGDSLRRLLESTPAARGEDALTDLRKILNPASAEDDGRPEQRI